MAKYLILIYGDEQRWDAETPAERQAKDAAHIAFNAATKAPGHQLASPSTATSLRTGADGGLSVTDGPFIEAKEALGGFYILDADDLDAAIAHAATLHEVSTDHAGVEIRPIVEHG